MGYEQRVFRVIFGFSSILYVALSSTDPNDVRILNEFRKGLENPDLLKWPENGDDPCGPPLWPHVFCNRDRVAQIQVQGLGLKGPLPQDFNQLSKLVNLGLQRNHFNGNLPSFSGLSELEYAYLDYNDFDTIPSDFFDGLTSIRVMALDNNPLNATAGWSLPNVLGASTQLVNLSLSSCNLVGLLPDFLGTLSSLSALKLSYNRLSGVIPMSFNQSTAQILWLNDQNEPGMTGPIDIISSMASLSQLWLQGNSFTGTIPDGIGKLDALRDLNLNRNQLVGLIPRSLAAMDLVKLDMSNNMLMGPIPEFKSSNVSYASNSFCQTSPGTLCALEVNALIDFLSGLNYPIDLASEWTGNDPCNGPWLGVSCNAASKVTIINLPKRKLQGTLSPSIGNLDLLHEIRLSGNNLSGQIPTNLTQLKLLRLLDVSGNNFQPPLPQFRPDVKVIVDGNPLLVTNPSKRSPQIHHPPINSTTPPVIVQSPQKAPSPTPSLGSLTSPPFRRKHTPVTGSSHDSRSSLQGRPKHQKSNGLKRFRVAIIVTAIASFLILVLLSILVYLYRYKNQKDGTNAPRTVVFHPRNSSDPENMVKIAVLSNTGSLFTHNESDTGSMDSGNLTISVQVLRKVTDNFAPKNELGRGGFGVVYKGELDDGTKIAVKRMEAGAICNKALDEFKSEIAVLSKVRHRHLVSLFGYSTEDNERLLVYEYMPKGALSKHLFHWKNFGLEPLMWKRRLMIALDVARGMEYLHSMAHQSFIHRDLKPSNILLDDEYRAKVSDFGLVKLAPDREKSVVTRLAGTFGYLAPEYAVTGKVTTKIDVFSYGVVLMELLTGLMALDEGRPEESRYLAEWFWRIKTSRDKLISAIDPVLNVKEDTSNSISVIAELAGYCTARDPNRRPDMGHAVSVLAPLVEQWKPFDDDSEDHSGIDLNQPLKEMLKGWQREGDEKEYSSNASFEDSLGSIPARPTGFADSFTSAHAR